MKYRKYMGPFFIYLTSLHVLTLSSPRIGLEQVQSKLHAVHPELGLWPRSSQERRTPYRTCVLDTPALTLWRSSTSEILHQSVSVVRSVCPWSTS